MNFSFWIFDVRSHSANNWSNLELAIVTNRHAGKARRESIVRGSWMSQHAIQHFGINNESDTFTDSQGNVYFGKMCPVGEGKHKVVHSLSAEEVYQFSLVEAAQAAAMKSVADATRDLQTTPLSSTEVAALSAA